ncbi:hypothetical protein JYB87_13110 [Shewanella avicenniae]|uniref:O-antigen polysaccharide polymerase Wzy n=1 Tax=Shewanella avicenniae TaxID=2814294 RepID=A0ABX7QML5_9GAMM|nr:hypothetical protein [Shewanella avicenniae]QSX32684.1 hypothetical protein JYB87_13110 [Shewanella avicenniae]
MKYFSSEDRNINFLIPSLFFASLFFQNFNFLRIDVETQPIFSIFFAFIFFVINRHRFKLTKADVFLSFLILMILLRFFFDLAFPYSSVNYVAYFSYLIGPVVFIFIGRMDFFNGWSAIFLKVYISISFMIAIGYLFSINLIMNGYQNISDVFFLRHYGIDTSSVRGLSFLYAEPSYAATGFAVSLVCLRVFFYKSIISRFELQIYSFLLVLCILTTKSLMGLLVILILFVRKSYVVTLVKSFLVFVPIIYVFGEALLSFLASNIPRVKQIQQAVSSINYNVPISDVLVAASLAEPSSSTRFISNLIGLLGMITNPFGYGAGGISVFWIDMVERFHLYFLYHHFGFIKLFEEQGLLKAQTYLFNAAFDFGVFFLAIFLMFLFVIFKSQYKHSKFNRILGGGYGNSMHGVVFLVLLFVFFQGQITNIFMWFLLSILYKKNLYGIYGKS